MDASCNITRTIHFLKYIIFYDRHVLSENYYYHCCMLYCINAIKVRNVNERLQERATVSKSKVQFFPQGASTFSIDTRNCRPPIGWELS